MDKRRLQVTERKRERRRVATYLHTDVDIGQGTRGVDIYMMVDGGVEQGGEEGRVVVEVLVAGDETEEISTNEVMFGDLDLLTMLIEDMELVGILIFDSGTGGRFEEVGEGMVAGAVKRMGSGRFSTGRSLLRARVVSRQRSTISEVLAGMGETGRESLSMRWYSAGANSWLSMLMG